MVRVIPCLQEHRTRTVSGRNSVPQTEDATCSVSFRRLKLLEIQMILFWRSRFVLYVGKAPPEALFCRGSDSAPCFHNNRRSLQLGSPVALHFVYKKNSCTFLWKKVINFPTFTFLWKFFFFKSLKQLKVKFIEICSDSSCFLAAHHWSWTSVKQLFPFFERFTLQFANSRSFWSDWQVITELSVWETWLADFAFWYCERPFAALSPLCDFPLRSVTNGTEPPSGCV